MHPAVTALVKSLTQGKVALAGQSPDQLDAVSQIARVYEIARNALEYRAQHLVRRAAIERILKRQMIFDTNPAFLTAQLKQELQWARYISYAELERVNWTKIETSITRHLSESSPDHNWLVGLISAEVEDEINPNPDYNRFTYFAFHSLRQVIKDQSPDLDLLLFVAADRVYAQSDDQQISFHLYQLISSQAPGKVLDETYRQFNLASHHPLLNPLVAVVRKHVGPLVLIRDMYFSEPTRFVDWLENSATFKTEADQVLSKQLSLMRGRINTAVFRSLLYIFLTKMLLGVGVEMPVELAFKGKIAYPVLAINLLAPVLLMWLITFNIKLTGGAERKLLTDRAWQILAEFSEKPLENDFIYSLQPRSSTLTSGVFYALYALLFAIVYWGIFKLLTAIGYSFLNVVIFIFFVGIVSFFAVFIRQNSQVYQYKRHHIGKTSIIDLLLLPFVVLGSWVSKGVARLNFLAFFFDFILEAPIKLLLKVLDGWAQFLSYKRDEVVG
ncbi:MAG: hypothetical protein Q7S31_03415 [bacterium]|nr:hypothetical protein [bacterium]